MDLACERDTEIFFLGNRTCVTQKHEIKHKSYIPNASFVSCLSDQIDHSWNPFYWLWDSQCELITKLCNRIAMLSVNLKELTTDLILISNIQWSQIFKPPSWCMMQYFVEDLYATRGTIFLMGEVCTESRRRWLQSNK